jgi:hypothetical protein
LILGRILLGFGIGFANQVFLMSFLSLSFLWFSFWFLVASDCGVVLFGIIY